MIIAGDLKLGSRIAEQDIAARFGLSKTPVREALLILKKEGLIEILPRKGSFVFALSVRDIHDLFDVRGVIELGAMRFAIQRNATTLLRDLGQNIERSEELLERDTSEYLKLDRQFHALFFRHAGNPHLNAFSDAIAAKMYAIRYRIAFGRGFKTGSIAAHREVFSHLQAGSIDAAAARLGQHIQAAIDPETIEQLVKEGSSSC